MYILFGSKTKIYRQGMICIYTDTTDGCKFEVLIYFTSKFCFHKIISKTVL